MEEKISILGFIEYAFRRKSDNRDFGFAEIAKVAEIAVDRVEFLVMKALSVGLIKGAINEVDQKVNVTWVRPRVLGKKQVEMMVDKVSSWRKTVKGSLLMVESNTSLDLHE